MDPDLETCLTRAVAVEACCRGLAEKDYQPDLVLVHSGWGDALHLASIWPGSPRVVYPELYGSAEALGFGYDPRLGPIPGWLQRCSDRQNLLALAALAHCSAAIVPTETQRRGFPALVQPLLQVLHEGVNLDQVRPDHQASFQLPDGQVLRPGDAVVTFISRTLEPLRGLHTLLEALPALLQAHPTVQVVVVGEALGMGYGLLSAHPGGHIGEWLDRVGDRLDPARLHLVGKLAYGELLTLLQVSAAHVSLTTPYTLSWSLLEAMACGAPVVGNRRSPVEDLIQHGRNGVLVDFNDPAALAAALLELLLQPERRRGLGEAARATVLQNYSHRQAAERYLALFSRLLAGCTSG
ncbi:glycosyltransferase [Vulcanococcus limneticus]|uniref:glycosyltransferase n=1 Tax=Vulcanococcus limneticus TaxID=2170428 RepID=UPI00398BCFD5